MANTQTLNSEPGTMAAADELQPGHWRGWLRLLFEAMASSLAIALLLAMSVLMGAAVARADTAPPALQVSNTPATPTTHSTGQESGLLKQAPDGTALLIRTEAGYLTAPLQRSDVRLQVTGNIVRARVSQTYSNPNDAWLNGRYQFPLPGDAAVDTLRMRVGERLITGVIQPRQAARQAFKKARDNGQRASLIEQHRPNVFTADVANLAPLSEVTIEIEYQQVLALTDGRWALRFPTVVAPRYQPAKRPDLSSVNYTAADDAQNILHEVAELAGEALPLPAQPIQEEPDASSNRLSLEVDIDAGMPVSLPTSLTHDIAVASIVNESGESSRSYKVMLRAEALADRDFELSWQPKAATEPQAELQIEQHGQDWYALLTVAPPDTNADTVTNKPREIILVLDTSGSMQGALPDAKKAVSHALQSLQPQDRFNIIEFNSEHSSLFQGSQMASVNNLQAARRFLRALEANGGTEMRGALMQALKSSVPVDTLSQLVFVTDGAVGNEHELFNLIETMLGDRKLFTVGIGSAPNDHFMRKAAAAGRGTFTFIADGKDVAPRMRALFDKLSAPMLTRLQLRDDRGELLDTGTSIRDLYAGEPVIQTFRLPVKPNALTIEAEQNDIGWQEPLTIRTVHDRGIDRLWARDEIDTLTEEIRRYAYDGKDPALLREQATKVAMNHHLVSAYTSLVAIEAIRARPQNETATDTQVPGQLPKGWKKASKSLQASALRSGAPLAQTSNGLLWQLLTGGVLFLIAAICFAAMLFRAQSLLDRHPG